MCPFCEDYFAQGVFRDHIETCEGRVSIITASRDQWKSDCVELAGAVSALREIIKNVKTFEMSQEAWNALYVSRELQDTSAKAEDIMERVKGDG
jgi:hypothetical protein